MCVIISCKRKTELYLVFVLKKSKVFLFYFPWFFFYSFEMMIIKSFLFKKFYFLAWFKKVSRFIISLRCMEIFYFVSFLLNMFLLSNFPFTCTMIKPNQSLKIQIIFIDGWQFNFRIIWEIYSVRHSQKLTFKKNYYNLLPNWIFEKWENFFQKLEIGLRQPHTCSNLYKKTIKYISDLIEGKKLVAWNIFKYQYFHMMNKTLF
jgi:hypothetical protein